MELAHALHLLGALATLIRGGFAVVAPKRFALRLGLAPADALARSELLAMNGALLASLGAFTFLVQDQVAFALLGGAWLAASASRVVGALLARELDARIWWAALRDAAFAILLLYPG